MMSAQRLLILLAVWLATCTGSAWIGWDYRGGKVAADRLDAIEIQAKLIEEATTRSEALKTQLSAARSALTKANQTITREIVRYEQVTPADQRCTLPGTWRVRHDAAARGMPLTPDAGSLALGSSGPVEDATALETVAENYAAARECAEKLNGWQRRYRALDLGRTP